MHEFTPYIAQYHTGRGNFTFDTAQGRQFTQGLNDLAKRFNLTFDAFGKEIIGGAAQGKLTLGDYANSALPPAPVTVTTGEEAEAYRLLSGTIKAAFGSYQRRRQGRGYHHRPRNDDWKHW